MCELLLLLLLLPLPLLLLLLMLLLFFLLLLLLLLLSWSTITNFHNSPCTKQQHEQELEHTQDILNLLPLVQCAN